MIYSALISIPSRALPSCYKSQNNPNKYRNIYTNKFCTAFRYTYWTWCISSLPSAAANAQTEVVLPVDVTRSREKQEEALVGPSSPTCGSKGTQAQPRRALRRHLSKRLPKQTWFISIPAPEPAGAGLGEDTRDTRLHFVQRSPRFHTNLFLRPRLQAHGDEGRTQGDSSPRSFQTPVACKRWPHRLFKSTVTMIPLHEEW